MGTPPAGEGSEAASTFGLTRDESFADLSVVGGLEPDSRSALTKFTKISSCQGSLSMEELTLPTKIRLSGFDRIASSWIRAIVFSAFC